MKAQELRQAFPHMLKGGEFLIIGMINGKYAPEFFYGAKSWLNHCYNIPSTQELILEAIDDIIDGHGIDSLYAHDDEFHDTPMGQYINMGDIYATTIVYVDNEYLITTLGDYIEYAESKGLQVK